jgi:glycosyltransferase involved in cell wall biosynthesis
MLKDHGLDFHCYIVGDGPLREPLKTLITEQHLDDHVTLVGRVPQEEIRRYYESADIFVLPSIQENLPNVLLESMAMGIPVIATGIAGIPELVENDRTGVVVKPDDIVMLAEAMKRFLEDPGFAQHLAQQGRRFVCEQFDIEASHEQIVRLYEAYGVVDGLSVRNSENVAALGLA